MIKLVILDRDGVLNEDRVDYVKNLEELKMIEGSAKAVAKLNKAGIKVAVATNQSCIGKGIITEQELSTIHNAITTALKGQGGAIDLWLHCPDDTESYRRKPAPGMLLEAMQHFSVVPENTVFIGDALRDLQAAEAAKCQPLLVRTGKGHITEKQLPESLKSISVCDDLQNAVELILKEI